MKETKALVKKYPKKGMEEVDIPEEGTKLNCYPVVTISRGTVVYENEKFSGKSGAGKLVRRN